ncbi:type 4a pilus biogenesis protein PilO [Colwellia psychrerythraea]|uniref:Type IV pilus biogenesis protein PilO n=1 Tax=Colwellia psychrerythraea (strain 34H / ATCC BAA-681) TaxID=167879 RepID=Q489N7_COLP3|nr:type 4a pilus biogenesis protein PilO [Colwellia psychrerythraea]AAZ26877.1 type IV pilus biogenesis protein PilO [Colwellia psychrerythraea 34H]
MKFDASQFDNLELDNIGQWPAAAKLLLAVFLAVMVGFLGYMGLISDQMKELDRVSYEEKTLKESYRAKYHVAANLDLFRAQMVEAEDTFANQLRSLPNSHEIPGLLDDITFVGTTSGLDFVKLEWQPEISKEIYIELPIDIEVIGPYHSFGQFVSKIAGLPRIVTLHDFKISISQSDSEILNLKLQAKTYRYQEEAAK